MACPRPVARLISLGRRIQHKIIMSNKIKAAIRVRPFLPSEVKNGYTNTKVSVDHRKKQIYVAEEPNRRSFHFDYLFSEEASQEDLYNGCKIDSMIDRAMEGYHSTIFAYGQTGSGKTHTMQGAEVIEDGTKTQLNGLIPKAVASLFKKIHTQPQRTFTISVSFLQIYNQKVFDLLNPASLNPKSLGSTLGGLRLRWSKNQQFTVENLFIFECKNDEQLMKYFLYGLKNRINSAHKLNMSSSRSHSILTIRLESFHHSDPTRILHSKMELVDLAGSERIGLTGTEGKLAKQSIDINKSLFTLRQVISILAEAGKTKTKDKVHVPYRDSKLTSILKQSIGGNSYSLMIACINPNDAFLEQNLSTLTYATKASYINNQPVVNDDPRSKIILDLRKQVKDLNQELNKANQHIEFIGQINLKSSEPGPSMDRLHRLAAEESEESKMPSPAFKKRNSQKLSGERVTSYDQFSERLVESINMVRQLLKSNKELREQLEQCNRKNEEKDIEIYQLTRENEYLKQRIPGESPPQSAESFFNTTRPPKNSTSGSSRKANPRLINSMNSTMVANGNMQGLQSAGNRGSLNYWNSMEINQYYLNEKGIDSMPTNFNRREINSAHNARQSQSRGNSEDSVRHAITANTTKRSWISKNSQPKKFLSFYNDPANDGSAIY